MKMYNLMYTANLKPRIYMTISQYCILKNQKNGVSSKRYNKLKSYSLIYNMDNSLNMIVTINMYKKFNNL